MSNIYIGTKDAERNIWLNHVPHFQLPVEFSAEARYLSDKAVKLVILLAFEAYNHSNTELHFRKALLEELTGIKDRSLTRAVAELNKESRCIRIQPKRGVCGWYQVKFLDPSTGKPRLLRDKKGKIREPWVCQNRPCPELQTEPCKPRKRHKPAKPEPVPVTLNVNLNVQGQAFDGLDGDVVFGPRKRKVTENVN